MRCRDTRAYCGAVNPTRGTPRTAFRLDPALIVRAKARAAERGETLTDVVRRALTEYAEEET